MDPKRPVDPRPGQRLRRLREHVGISMRALARQADIAPSTMEGYERGRWRIPVERLHRFARLLGCRPAELLKSPEASLPPSRNRKRRQHGNELLATVVTLASVML
jgi:transcriptional regulator with XRE-family HTH domain